MTTILFIIVGVLIGVIGGCLHFMSKGAEGFINVVAILANADLKERKIIFPYVFYIISLIIIIYGIMYGIYW